MAYRLISNGHASSALSTTFTLTGIDITAGKDMLVCVGWKDTTVSITSVTDSAGNTYVERFTSIGTDIVSSIWEAQSTISGTGASLTITFSASVIAVASWNHVSGIVPQSTLGGTQNGTENAGTTSLVGTTMVVQEIGNSVIAALVWDDSVPVSRTVVQGTQIDFIGITSFIGMSVLIKGYTLQGNNQIWVQLDRPVNWSATSCEMRAGGLVIVPPFADDGSGTVVPWTFDYEDPGFGGGTPGEIATIVCDVLGGGCTQANNDFGNDAG